MAVSHWWFALAIDDQDYDRFHPGFEAASVEAVLSPASRATLERWARHPSAFDDPGSASGDEVNSFIGAFNLPGFVEFARAFVTGAFSTYLTEERLLRFASVRQRTPVSVVWQALGRERAERLPGTMGNVLLRPSEVPRAHAEVVRAYAGTTVDDLFEKALRYCGSSVFVEEHLREVLTFFPDCFGRAMHEGKGLLSLARPAV